MRGGGFNGLGVIKKGEFLEKRKRIAKHIVIDMLQAIHIMDSPSEVIEPLSSFITACQTDRPTLGWFF